MLVQTKSILPCQDESTVEHVKDKCVALNKYICNRAKTSDEIAFLASPTLGGGHPFNRFERIFLAAMYEGKNSPEEIAQYTWQVFSEQGISLTRAGGGLLSAEENLAGFRNMAKTFLDNRLSLVKALQII